MFTAPQRHVVDQLSEIYQFFFSWVILKTVSLKIQQEPCRCYLWGVIYVLIYTHTRTQLLQSDLSLVLCKRSPETGLFTHWNCKGEKCWFEYLLLKTPYGRIKCQWDVSALQRTVDYYYVNEMSLVCFPGLLFFSPPLLNSAVRENTALSHVLSSPQINTSGPAARCPTPSCWATVSYCSVS